MQDREHVLDFFVDAHDFTRADADGRGIFPEDPARRLERTAQSLRRRLENRPIFVLRGRHDAPTAARKFFLVDEGIRYRA